MNFNQTRLMMAELGNALSPIRLFNTQQARKLGSGLANGSIPRMANMSARSAVRAAWRGDMGEAFAGPAARGMPWDDVFGNWWRGHHLDDVASPSRFARLQARPAYQRIAAANAFKRRVAVGVLGAAVAGPTLLGRDNVVSAGGRAGLTLGASLGASAWAIEKSFARPGFPGLRAGGVGFAGLTVMNMLRTGDQVGPF